MHFISNGDYGFPLHFRAYWLQQVYMWSYQHGAPNPDGIMRLPGRLLDIVVFAAFGNLAIAYFYVATCLLITYAAFYWFSKVFLEVRQRGTLLLGALLFTLNPIFLGNLSKVGLILAVAMLPIALAALKLGFEKKRFSYFLLYVAALNISLIHPFTFSVNLIASGAYLLYIARQHITFVRDSIYKFGLVALTAVVLNAYLILPLLALGTVSKDALSSSVASTPVNYTSLVDVANTGDIFTGLSLSKGVLKDYEFYGARTWPFYFLGVFALYVILFAIYVNVGKRIRPGDQRRFVVSFALFLVLLVLSTATFLHVDTLIKFMIGLPSGWMFRSPLKWQLYMPLALFTSLVIALKYVLKGKGLRWIYVGLIATFVLMNTYLCVQIYQRLLTPRSVNTFAALANTDLEQKNVLFVNANTCMAYARSNPATATELNEVLSSKQVQVKDVEAGNLDAVALGQYDYVLGCQAGLDNNLLTKRYAFVPSRTFASGVYALYRNTKPVPYIGAVHGMSTLDPVAGAMSLGGKYAFAKTASGGAALPFNFATDSIAHPTTGLQDMFDTLSPASIHGTTLETSLKPLQPTSQAVYLTRDPPSSPLYYTTQGTHITVSTIKNKESKPVNNQPVALLSGSNQSASRISFSYNDPSFTYKNSVANPSLEQGLWQNKVGDCNAYDANPSIAMRLDKTMHTQGNQSLQLAAKTHIACTGPQAITVKTGEHYLLHFDYASNGGRAAGYYVGFNNDNSSSDTGDDTLATPLSTGARLDDTRATWMPMTTEIVIPDGATQAHLVFYAYPDNTAGTWGRANYDNVSFTHIPDVKSRFFVVSAPAKAAPTTQNPIQTSFTVLNPTKTLITVASVDQPFYLTSKESYSSLWQLHANTGAHGIHGLFADQGPMVAQQDHLRINGFANGWYVDPQAVCTIAASTCVHNADGSYNLRLVMVYAPQRWFEIGSMISCVAVGGVALYIAYDIYRRRRQHHAKPGGVR